MMETFTFRLRNWLSNLPIKDPVERRMASLVQVILLGFIAIILIAAILNLVVPPGIAWQVDFIRSSIFLLIIGFPLVLLRRGYFRSSVLIIIAIFFILETVALSLGSLRGTAETLPFFPLTIILSGLLLGRRALVLACIMSAGVILLSTFREERAEVKIDSIVIASNFILLNGLISLFLDQFGLTLRTALASALEREGELQNEINVRRQAEEELRASEQKFSIIYDKAPFAAVLSELPNGVIVNVNEAFERVFGYTKQEAAGKTSLELGINPDSESRARISAELQAQGSVYDTELMLVTKSGVARVFLVNIDLVGIGGQKYILQTAQDITERKNAEKMLRVSEERFRRIVDTSLDAVIGMDASGCITQWNAQAEAIFGWSHEEAPGQSLAETIIPPDLREAHRRGLGHFLETREGPVLNRRIEVMALHRNGQTFPVELTITPLITAGIYTFSAFLRDITDRKRAEQKIQRRVAELEALYQSGIAFSQTFDQNEIAEKVIEVLRVHLNWHHAAVRVRHGETDELELLAFSRSDDYDNVEARIQSVITRVGQGMVGWVIEHGQALRAGNLNDDPRYVEIYPGMKSGLYVPLKIYEHTLGCISVESDQPDAFTQEDERLLTTLAVQAAVAIENARLFQTAQQELSERKRAEEALREKEHLLSEAQRIGHIGSWSYDIVTDTLQYSDKMYRLLDISKEEFPHNNEGFLNLIYPSDRPMVAKWMEDIKVRGETKEIEFLIFRKNSELHYIRCRGAVEFDTAGKPVSFIGTAQDITERKLAEIQIHQQIERLTALSKIDQAIISSFDLNVTLDLLLSQVISQLQVDTTDVLLLNLDKQILEYAAGRGFRTNVAQSAQVRMGESHAGRAAKERRLVKIENLTDDPNDPLLTTLLAGEDFVCYYGVPLIAKGNVIGVLEVFHRTVLEPNQEWFDFLSTLAGQAAIAIDNAQLFDDLQASNHELIQAYDATIEGWSHAMDLRDKETEGHTQRVTEMTMRLAHQMGISEAKLVHIKRGALLHDIGKLGVPDHILLKSDKLTDKEWAIMRKHPKFAYEMLSSIRYLKPALNIP